MKRYFKVTLHGSGRYADYTFVCENFFSHLEVLNYMNNNYIKANWIILNWIELTEEEYNIYNQAT